MESIFGRAHSLLRGDKMSTTNGANVTDQPHPPEPEMSELQKLLQRGKKSAAGFQTLFQAIRAPLPTETGDGSSSPTPEKENLAIDIIRDLGRQDIKTLGQLVKAFGDTATGKPLDDRHYLMEAMIKAAAAMPEDKVQHKLTQGLISTLWHDLPHPPQTLLGDEWQFRQPDGSNNSYVNPRMGASGMPYAQTVAPMMSNRGVLPDPGVLFDSLMARKSPTGQKHPNGISSMLFYLASIIIHDVFKTDHKDYRISRTSSYLDLAPLYGSDWNEQKRMRTMKDGKIKPDCFSETRLLNFPPGVGALLILFNRYHNYVVEQLALINEDDRFTENPRKPTVNRYGEEINKRDDDLFQTARLITCGLYVNIILRDYVRTILNLNRTDSNWALDPRIESDQAAMGTGNQVSAEFNLVYRWHSATSEKDDKWTQQLFQELDLPDDLKKHPENAAKPENIRHFLETLALQEHKVEQQEPSERSFPALQHEKLTRYEDGPFKGSFPDDAIAQILNSSIEDCANAMGPQQVPTIMKAIEILGIRQARTWQCATLNEFRKKFSLKPHETWEDITENKEVQYALKHLYDTPDRVELYPGLVVEDAKQPMRPGSGLCPSYTVSRGVLSDAVALVRGDRFFTTSFTPALLTNWGYEECKSDPSIDNGCVFYKLFLHGLPNNYDGSSIYAHYPLTIPSETKIILQGLNKDHLYNFDTPKPKPRPTLIFSQEAATKILNDKETFHVTWSEAMVALMGPKAKNFMLAGDAEPNKQSRELMEKPMYPGGSSRGMPKGDEPWLIAVREFYEHITTQLLKEKSFKLGGTNYVDLIRDVGNLTHVHFGAELFSIPLKTEQFEHGVFTEQQLYFVMAAVFIAVFFDLDPSKSLPLRQKAKESTDALAKLIIAQVEALRYGGTAYETLSEIVKPTAPQLKHFGIHLLRKLTEADRDVEDLVWGNIMGTAGGMVANQGQLFGQAMDYFFTAEEEGGGLQYWPEIHRLAKLDTPGADEELMHYLMEGARLSGETGVFREVQKDITIVDDAEHVRKEVHNFKKGDVLMVVLKAVSRDPKAFPNPDKLDLTRPLESYPMLGWGPHKCFGLPMTRVALTTMLKVIGRLENLRPAPVSMGRSSQPSSVKKVLKEFVPGDSIKGSPYYVPDNCHYHLFMMEDWQAYFPFPMSLKINFDGDVPDVKPRSSDLAS